MIDTLFLELKPKSWENVIGGLEDHRTHIHMTASCVLGRGKYQFYVKDHADPLEDCNAWIYILRAYEKTDHKSELLGDFPDPIGKFMQLPKGEKTPFGAAGLFDDGWFDIRLYPGATAFDDLWGRSRLGGAMPTTVSITVKGTTLGEGDDDIHWGTEINPVWLPIIDFRLTAEVQLSGTNS